MAVSAGTESTTGELGSAAVSDDRVATASTTTFFFGRPRFFFATFAVAFSFNSVVVFSTGAESAARALGFATVSDDWTSAATTFFGRPGFFLVTDTVAALFSSSIAAL